MAIISDYTPGQIVYLRRYPAGDSLAFLNGRPVVIVSEPHNIFNTVLITPFSTQNRPGISVTFKNGKQSYVHPWSLFTVPVNRIEDVKGFVTRNTLHEIIDAAAFHIGKSEKLPKYLEGIREDYEVKHNPATVNNTWIGYRSAIETREELKTIPTESSVVIVAEDIEEDKKEEENVIAKKKTPRKKRGSLPSVMNNLKEKDIVDILNKNINIAEFCNKNNICRSSYTRLYGDLLEKYYGPDEIYNINNILAGNARNFNKLSQTQRSCLSIKMAMNIDKINVKDPDILKRFINNYRKINGIFLSDGKKWRTFRAENRLSLK